VPPSHVPPDAILASGSGLDPHISPAYAREQVTRVARERGLAVAKVEALVAAHTQGPWLGFLGEPRVNVLELNLALDAIERLTDPARHNDHREGAAMGAGRLRVYLGSAPGVGKTYAMLGEGHRRAERGT
jgi:hypothetical protein